MQEPNLHGPPWPTPALWRAANQAVAESIDRCKGAMDAAMVLGQTIRRRIEALDNPMNALCASACHDCRDSCCSRAKVWFDFRDLIYLQLGAPAIPTDQLIASMDQTCRYLTNIGCALPRVQRPFVCTWYVCAAQKDHLRHWPRSGAQFLLNSLEALKAGRRQLENLFIQSVVQFNGNFCSNPLNFRKAR